MSVSYKKIWKLLLSKPWQPWNRCTGNTATLMPFLI